LSVEEHVALEERILTMFEGGELEQHQVRQHRSGELLRALEGLELVTEAAKSRLTIITRAT
jgi:hypothetical protein